MPFRDCEIPTRGVSVVICCYNSTSRLEATLSHLARQRITQQLDWEVIIVDNGSDDATAELAYRLWPKTRLAHFA